MKALRRRIEKLIENNSPIDFNLKWFFGLDIAELAGEEGEHCSFDDLVSLKDETCLQNAIILHSATFLTDIASKEHQEFDFLIFFPARKLLIGIESKRQLTDTAFTQLNTYYRLFEEGLSDQLGPGWTFFPVISVQKDLVKFQNHHYIHSDTDINIWLSSILKKYPVLSEADTTLSLENLKKVVRIVVFTIHLSKKNLKTPIIVSNWVDYITEAIKTVSNSNNILFYSARQLPVLTSNDPAYKKVVIHGGFGVGKTFLLQEKAIMLNELPDFKGRVMFLSLASIDAPKSLLYHKLRHDFDQCGIKLRKFCPLNIDLMVKEIQNDDIKALLIDECDVLRLQEDSLIDILLKLVEVIWVAPNAKSQYAGRDNFLRDDFLFLNLSQNLRNSRATAQMAKKHAEKSNYLYKEGVKMPPANFPSGCPPTFVHTFKEAVQLARNQSNHGILCILEIFDNLKNFDIKELKTFTDFLDQMQEEWKIYDMKPWIEQSDFNECENPYKYLCDGKFLFASNRSVIGFEWPTVISFASRYFSYNFVEEHECNYFLRCTTNLILVNFP
eukprot:TCONS_00015242-protein